MAKKLFSDSFTLLESRRNISWQICSINIKTKKIKNKKRPRRTLFLKQGIRPPFTGQLLLSYQKSTIKKNCTWLNTVSSLFQVGYNHDNQNCREGTYRPAVSPFEFEPIISVTSLLASETSWLEIMGLAEPMTEKPNALCQTNPMIEVSPKKWSQKQKVSYNHITWHLCNNLSSAKTKVQIFNVNTNNYFTYLSQADNKSFQNCSLAIQTILLLFFKQKRCCLLLGYQMSKHTNVPKYTISEIFLNVTHAILSSYK